MSRPRVGLAWVRGKTTMDDVLRDVAKAVCAVWEADDWSALHQKGPIVMEVREEWMQDLTSRYFRCNNIAAHVGVQLSFVPVFPGDRIDGDPHDPMDPQNKGLAKTPSPPARPFLRPS